MSFQKIIIAGNLGKDPELRYGQNGGNAFCRFSVAVSEREKDGDDWKERTEWFNVVCFGKTAENAGQYLSKGKKVLVEGRIRQKTYQKSDGSTGYSTDLMADSVVFMSPKNEGEPSRGSNGAARKPAPQRKREPEPEPEGFIDDDLPF